MLVTFLTVVHLHLNVSRYTYANYRLGWKALRIRGHTCNRCAAGCVTLLTRLKDDGWTVNYETGGSEGRTTGTGQEALDYQR